MDLLNPVLSFLFPVVCGNCDSIVEEYGNGTVCRVCWSRTTLFSGTETLCAKCGKFHSLINKGPLTYCGQCREDDFDIARSCGPYGGGLKTTVLNLKTTPHLASHPAQLLFDCYCREAFRNIDLIIPIPISKRRRFERGFNQAEVMANSFSKHTGLPVDALSLHRPKHTQKNRATMDFKGRRMSVEGVFELRRKQLITGKNILLIDDVLTSGATVSIAARELKKGGASRVDVLTLARAV